MIYNTQDLEIIFTRFGKITSCDIIRDSKTGDSLCYAFIGFDSDRAAEDAFFKMNNVLIDDRRIKVGGYSSACGAHMVLPLPLAWPACSQILSCITAAAATHSDVVEAFLVLPSPGAHLLVTAAARAESLRTRTAMIMTTCLSSPDPDIFCCLFLTCSH